MDFFNILLDTISNFAYLLVIFLALGLIVFYFLSSKNKNQKENFEIENENVILEIEKEKKSIDPFDLNSIDVKEYAKELEDIKKKFNDGNEELIKVDFSKAMYILKNFNNYNMYSSEDGKVIFQKIKEVIDMQSNVSSEISNEIEQLTVESKKFETPNFSKKIEKLEDGTIKISTELGYTIMDGNKVIEAVDFSYEENKLKNDSHAKTDSEKEELKAKIENFETKLLEGEKERKNQEKN